MKLIASVLMFAALLLAACGGDDDDGGSTTGTTGGAATGGTATGGAATGGTTGATTGSGGVVIAEEDADRVAHEGLPAVEDLPGAGWVVTAEDEFDSGGSASFLEFIEGNPECATLENLTALESVFGADEEEEPPIGQAQREFEQQDPQALIPTNIEVTIEVDESASGSQGAFGLVKELFESDETANCIISVLNEQFMETGPAGVQIDVSKGSGSASPPQSGATMAFDIDMSVSGIELSMAMEMYFWPYGNATVQALFLGTNDTLTSDLVGGVLQTVDTKLKAAAE
jgi:hypothetical protein